MTTPHGHLWQLPDGTGLHAPAAAVTVEEGTGRLCCHFCGRWFASLGSHVRVHGRTADSYRSALGLALSTPLTCSEVSTAISRRQAERFATSADARAALAVGQQMARAGVLADSAREAREGRAAQGQDPVQSRVRREESLSRGRQTQHERRSAALQDRLAAAGFEDLAEYLRERYLAGASLEVLAVETRLGRVRLRGALAQAGVPIRSSGQNTLAGRRSRALRAEGEVADRVGAEDLVAWLVQRRSAGASMSQLARETGRSTHWVRWRLEAS